MTRKYTWLLFDADGTLFDYDRAEAVALEKTFRDAGISCGPQVLPLYRKFNQQLWKELEAGTVSPAVLRVLRFERLLQTIGSDVAPLPVSESYLRNLSECTHLIEGAHELLESLHRAYRIAIATNGLSVVQRPRVGNSAIRDYIADLVISEEIGKAKPAMAFFDTAFERMGNPDRSAVLMVGDSLSSDIAGACNYGMDTCWYNPAAHARPEHLAITYEIRSLGELGGILK